MRLEASTKALIEYRKRRKEEEKLKQASGRQRMN
jgi:hypothetical protein